MQEAQAHGEAAAATRRDRKPALEATLARDRWRRASSTTMQQAYDTVPDDETPPLLDGDVCVERGSSWRPPAA